MKATTTRHAATVSICEEIALAPSKKTKGRDPGSCTWHATARLLGKQVAEKGAISADVFEVSGALSGAKSRPNRKHNTAGSLLRRGIDQRMHAGAGGGGAEQGRQWGRARVIGDRFAAARKSSADCSEEMETGDTEELEVHRTVSVFSF